MSGGAPAIGAAALIPNPALRPLEFLVGEWRTTGTHPMLSGDSLVGRTSFTWEQGGAFLVMRSQVDHPKIPDGLAIIGSDDGAGRFAMIYFDQRGVSRIFEVTLGEGTVTWRRDDPEFAQSVTLAAEEGGARLIGTGSMSIKGGEWTDDLSQVYTRDGTS